MRGVRQDWLRPAFSPSSGVLLLLIFLTACGKKPARVSIPPPAGPPPESQPARMPAPPPAPRTKPPRTADEPGNDQTSEFGISPDAVPLFTTTGMASWYGPPYHNRLASNGEVFDMNAMTAASLTLPLGTIVRVTNVKTGDSTLVRINDRGPFVEGRILDLSMAAAKRIDLWRAGVAQVKLEVLKTPSPLDTGGRWCVQIGSLQDEDSAARLQDHLQRRYHEAKVIKFLSPVGVWWVRVRVAQDDRSRAEELARETQPDEGTVFLVRLD
jgi:rare lipoprotein A